MDAQKIPQPVADVMSNEASDVTYEEKAKYAAFFREVLKEGRSLVVVGTESRELVASACVILDRLGLQLGKPGLEEMTSSELRITSRQVGDAAVAPAGVPVIASVIIDMRGRITVGEGNLLLREIVGNLVESGKKDIVLNLGDVTYVDSSGLGELVRTHTTIRNLQGELKLANLSKRVEELLQMTKLSSVFDIYEDEASAIAAFRGHSLRKATA